MQINLMPDVSLFAVMVIFIMNYLVVRKFFLEPINRVMEERAEEKRTADDLYEKALTRFNEATAHIEAQIHAAKRDGAQIREQLRGEAAAHRARLVEKTHADGQQVISEADVKLGQDLKAARERIVTESEALARVAAERILGRAV